MIFAQAVKKLYDDGSLEKIKESYEGSPEDDKSGDKDSYISYP